jgi:lipopolysaccharide export system permease protein
LGQLSELKPDYQALDALRYVFWDAPAEFYNLLPIAALIGAVVGLGTLASNSELVVMRSSGVSLWRIVGWVLRPAVLLMVCSLVVTEWVIPYTSEQAQQVRSTSNSISALGEVRGYWVREHNRYVRVDYASASGELRGIRTVVLNDQHRVAQTLLAQQGQYQKGQKWQLTNVAVANVQPDGRMIASTLAQQTLALPLQPRFIHLVTQSPEDLAPSQLWNYIGYLRQQGFVQNTYRLALWQKLAAPVSLAALVVIACSFIFGPLRQQSVGFRLVIALFVGLGFRYLQDFLGYASLIYTVSPGWFVVLPIVLMLLVGSAALRRMH